jgi:calcineurin-like phosphoesterase family protein
MPDVFVISDTHFFHSRILTFKRDDGSPVRSFASVEHMHEVMVERWNAVVKPGDMVYHLGDVSWVYGDALTHLMSRLNGSKRLLVGNHDQLKGTGLMDSFQKVDLWRVFGEEGFFCSHFPTLHTSFPRSCVLNVHGHIHHQPQPLPEYLNVSVEAIDYTPVPMDVILDRVKVIREKIERRRAAMDDLLGMEIN